MLFQQSLQGSTLFVGGRRIIGNGADEIVTISEPNEAGTVQGTADGITLWAGNLLRYKMATITVAQGAPGWVELRTLRVFQEINERTLFPFVWSIQTGNTRTTLQCVNGKFTKWPDEVWQKTQQFQTWEMLLPDVIVTDVLV